METTPETITVFAQTNFRNRVRKFGILKDDRRRHVYLMGKTGMGKTTMIENMVISDIYAGNGVAVVDPHGDFAATIIEHIPAHRVQDVIYFNPSDTEYPIGFNILEELHPEYRHLVANGLVSVFKKIWADSWGPRLEYILMNTILALIEYPGSTLLGVLRMLVDKSYRKKVVSNVRDPMVRSFWENEYANYNDKFRSEAIAPIQNKVGQFLSSSIIRNLVGQPKSTIDIRDIMDHQKILIMNLSKGRIGEENSALLGAMMVTKIQLAAMSRADIPEEDRKDFYLYVDEFQNFATESFADILSEARKYRLNLIMAHQYIEQLEEEVAAAVFGNVGTLVIFRIGAADAEFLEKEFEPTFTPTDLVNITKYQIILKLMIHGVASQPFSAVTLPPLHQPTGNGEKVIRLSRERFARSREQVEERILRWSGITGMSGEGEEQEGPPLSSSIAPQAAASQPREPRPRSAVNEHAQPREYRSRPSAPTQPVQPYSHSPSSPANTRRDSMERPQNIAAFSASESVPNPQQTVRSYTEPVRPIQNTSNSSSTNFLFPSRGDLLSTEERSAPQPVQTVQQPIEQSQPSVLEPLQHTNVPNIKVATPTPKRTSGNEPAELSLSQALQRPIQPASEAPHKRRRRRRGRNRGDQHRAGDMQMSAPRSINPAIPTPQPKAPIALRQEPIILPSPPVSSGNPKPLSPGERVKLSH